MPELVVFPSLVAVLENLEGCGDLLEFLLRLLVAGVLVGVVLNGELAVRLFDFIIAGVPVDPEHFVVVFFRHWT